MARTRNFADVIRAKLALDPELAKAVQEESFNAHIAQQVHDARTAAGLTQQQLADRCGTRQSVISRIEDADYEGHSLGLLKRIAEALERNLQVEFCPSPAAINGKQKGSQSRKPREKKVGAKAGRR